MSYLLRRLTTSGAIITAVLAISAPSHSQSFSLGTTVTQTARLYSYVFTLNYDQAGAVLGLTDNIWDWTFYMDPSVPTPTAITLPKGWKYTYDQPSGEFDFYTEGPSGFGNGDFGPNVVLPGALLAGFGLTTPAAPDLSIAFATDAQFNQDATLATLPTAVPAAAPEPSVWATLGLGAVAVGLLAVRCRRRAMGMS